MYDGPNGNHRSFFWQELRCCTHAFLAFVMAVSEGSRMLYVLHNVLELQTDQSDFFVFLRHKRHMDVTKIKSRSTSPPTEH